MKKTAKQLVYDAIDYMRKPTIDVALSPTQDSDDVFETYGWTKPDVCKLCQMISIDAEKDIPHAPIHAVNTVGEIVIEIEKLIKRGDLEQAAINSSYMLSKVAKMQMADELSELMVGVASIRALYQLGNSDLTNVIKLEDLLLSIMLIMKDINDPNNSDEFVHKIMTETTPDQFREKRKQAVIHWAKMMEDARRGS